MANKIYQDSDGNTSSKRIIGGVGFSLFIVMAIIAVPFYSIYTGNDIGLNSADVLKVAGWACASILLGGVVEKFGKKA